VILHPDESDLALYAGNDLSAFGRLRVEWHLRRCGRCQQEVTEFSEQRAALKRDAAEPDFDSPRTGGWQHMAAEMKANIRLGLEAGNCIAPEPSGKLAKPMFWPRLAAGVACALLLAGGGVWLDKAWLDKALLPHSLSGSASGVVLGYSENGIQVRNGNDVTAELSNLRRDQRGDVVYSVNAQGGVGASYVDQETGMVTVNNIYYGQ